MARTSKSFERKKPKFKVQPRTLILCEDSKSCLIYLQEAARHYRSFASIQIAHCGKTDPLGIIGEARKQIRVFESVFCAIDRDSHHGFDDALRLAERNGVKVIASFPSYEFWLLLHFRKTRAPYMAAGALSAGDRIVRDLLLENGMDIYSKGATRGLFLYLLSRLPEARKRSIEVLAEARADGEMNPSTLMHDLLDHFEELGNPQPITT